MTSDYISPPTIFLMGCRPWPPPNDRPGQCPVCGRGILAIDHGTYCGWSDEGTPAFEARVRGARLGLAAVERLIAGESKSRLKLAKVAKTTLSETARRRIWNGYRSNLYEATAGADVTNLAAAGRAWLTAIGQEPNWEITLTLKRDRDTIPIGRAG